MLLSSPNLDNRTFRQMVEEARRLVGQACPEWTDLTPHDPGMTLLELFAYLTEIMVYRLNRLPDKAYAEFLKLMGVKLQPPSAASVRLTFSIAAPQDQPVTIRRGTRVTVSRAGGEEAPVFVTADEAILQPKQTEIEVLAHHCDLVEAELAGVGTGLAGQSVTAKRPPIVSPMPDGLDLFVGVQATADELETGAHAVLVEGKRFRIWRQVENFSDLGEDRRVYAADRVSGVISFAPAVRVTRPDGSLSDTAEMLARVPPAGREIRLWYRRGGGLEGNVARRTLATLKDPMPGISVTNSEPASGGRAVETLSNALVRGPQELHSLKRAVTARDFERVALSASGAISRVMAYTQGAVWSYAAPGSVEILMVPALPDGAVTREKLLERQGDVVRDRVLAMVDERRPLGIRCVVNWVRYKMVRVKARVMVHREENAELVKGRVLRRLEQMLTPLPPGWEFGEALRASQVYEVMLSEPGVRYVEDLKLVVDDVPEKQILSVAADSFQPGMWYAATGDSIYRSTSEGDGWEPAAKLAGEQTALLRTHPGKPGLVAAVTRPQGDGASSRVHISTNCGDSWSPAADVNFRIEDLAWLPQTPPALLLACSAGLYKLEVGPGATPVQAVVDPANLNMPLFAVVAAEEQGFVHVAVAAQQQGGVFLSDLGGAAKSFRLIGLKNEDVRILAVQRAGPRAHLWAGVFAPGNEPAGGVFHWEFRGDRDDPGGWRNHSKNWKGGSCYGLAFAGDRVFAATYHMGVLSLDSDHEAPSWQEPPVTCGLPLRDIGRLQQVRSVAVDPKARALLAAGPDGIFRSGTDKPSYTASSKREFTDKVTLPPTWLFCPGEHDIQVKAHHEAS